MSSDDLRRHAMLRCDVWRTRLPDHEALNAALLDEIRTHQREQPDPLDKSFPGCWRGVRRYDADGPLVAAIERATFEVLNRYRAEERDARDALDPNEFVLDVFYWTNVNAKGALNALHDHADAGDIAGVYYVQGEGTGDIVFKSAQWTGNEHAAHVPFSDAFSVAPLDGELILFPSYLGHEVAPNPGDRERINLAFNVTVVRKGAGPAAISRVRPEHPG